MESVSQPTHTPTVESGRGGLYAQRVGLTLMVFATAVMVVAGFLAAARVLELDGRSAGVAVGLSAGVFVGLGVVGYGLVRILDTVQTRRGAIAETQSHVEPARLR
jgi:hypothetical protein